MSSAHSMNARKCVHAKKSYPSQAFAHESSKVGGRETGKTEARRLMERKAAQQNKNISKELKQGLPAQIDKVHQVQVLTNRHWVKFSLHSLHIITYFHTYLYFHFS